MSPRESIARALWLAQPYRRTEEWPDYFAWHESEVAKGNTVAAGDSAVGKCVAQAERILRLIEAAGLEVREKP